MQGYSSNACALRLLLVGLALNFLLVLPAWWQAGQAGSVWIAPEAWLVPALSALMPATRIGTAVRFLLAISLAFVIIAGSFDGLVRSVLGRPLNVFVDVLMLRSGFHLLDGSLGRWAAIIASVAVAAATIAIVWGVLRLLRAVAGSAPSGTPLLLGVCLALSLPWSMQYVPGVESPAASRLAQQARQFEQTRRARRELLAAAGDPAFEARALAGLAGRDVYIVFVESYGGSVLDQPRYADRIAPLLARLQGGLKSAGLSAVSGRVVAPIRGGQSWLSHATALSGLAIDNQLWYRMLLARDIGLLTDDFRVTGHVTINLSPAIVMDWPEGEALGFNAVYAATDMGYEGPRLGWATMPDEYTLHALSDRIRPGYDSPVFAQVALISSHWPWAPVIELVGDTRPIGNGRIYERWRGLSSNGFGLWLDLPALREAYGRSIGYSLEVTLDWARRRLPKDALLIVLGDHQPATLVTGREADATVPVHVISGDSQLLTGFRQRGFVPGLQPAATAEAGMERLRHWLRDDFVRGSGDP